MFQGQESDDFSLASGGSLEDAGSSEEAGGSLEDAQVVYFIAYHSWYLVLNFLYAFD